MLFTIITLTIWVISPAETPVQKDSVLYLKFQKQSNNIERTWIGQPPRSYDYNYKIVYDGVDYTIRFLEPKLTNIDTVSLDKIKSWDIKSYKWLKEYFLEYFNYFEGDNPYINKDGTARFFKFEEVDRIVIVEIDRENNRALMHQVVHQKYK